MDWKQHPITQEVLNTIKIRIRDLESELGISAGVDSLHDRFKVGAIAAYKDFYFLDMESKEETF